MKVAIVAACACLVFGGGLCGRGSDARSRVSAHCVSSLQCLGGTFCA